MTPEFCEELRVLIDANRTRALWSWPANYFPATAVAARRVLEQIAARSDRSTFVRARQLLLRLERHG